MKRISSNVQKIKPRYTAVVIGSGYGGGIAAARLARAGQSVCLLERGEERLPGEYPNELQDLKGAVQLDTDYAHYGPHRAMVDIRMNRDITAVIGCGLGGTSLINANVALELDKSLFKANDWPQVFQDNPDELDPYYDRARGVLDPSPYPDDHPTLNKLEALKVSAEATGGDFYKPPINVNFVDKINAFGVYQPGCNNCGNCCSGCNYGSKNTTLMNYLPDAHNHGAEIFTCASVRYIERDDDGWVVHISETPPENKTGTDDQASFVPFETTVRADVVVLGAGTLGSTEILTRSRDNGLPLSPSLGQGFSGNGDALAFGYNCYWKVEEDADGKKQPLPINGIGEGVTPITRKQMPGPCITGIIDKRGTDVLGDKMVIEEGVIPGSIGAGMPPLLLAGDAVSHSPFAYGPMEAAERLESAARLGSALMKHPKHMADEAYRDAVARTQTYLVMSHDDAGGELVLEDDRLRIRWPDAGRLPTFKYDDDTLQKANAKVQGQYMPNPLWSEAMGRQLITVHPVGGCRMADDFADGVVNDHGQVWAAPGEVHDGLYVTDGSILPGAAAVNPLLTISALAERSLEHLIADRGWSSDATMAPEKPGRIAWAGSRPGHVGRNVGSGPVGIVVSMLKRAWSAIKTVVLWVWMHLKAFATKIVKAILKRLIERDPHRFAPSVTFTETMEGFISTDIEPPDFAPPWERISDRFELARARGERASTPLDFRLTLATDDLWKTTTAPDRPATANGEVHCSALSASPMHVHDGGFHMLPADEDVVDTWVMTYDLMLERVDDSTLHFLGKKYLVKRDGSNIWTDLTKLYVTITDTETNEIVAEGILNLDLQDFIRQAATAKMSSDLSGIWAWGPIKRAVEWYFVGEFATTLGESVVQAYGGIFADLNNFAAKENNPDGEPRQRRQLKAPDPTEHVLHVGEANSTIKLFRYQGGSKGPVILAPGFSVTAGSFAIDTVEENLVEYLCERDYDVWLFAYRASPDSGSSATSFTLDDIARQDWPAAVAHVRNATGHDVQIVAHCVASMTVLMSLLDGLQGVRSVVSSQLTLHPVVNWLNDLKADIGLPDLLKSAKFPDMGIDLTKEIDLRSTVFPDTGKPSKAVMADKALDAGLWIVPVPEGEECNNPVCRRVFGVFGPSYTHSQLNHRTHNAMLEMFGKISTTPFDQLAAIVERGYPIDVNGDNVYMPHVDRLAVPIDFVVGRQNQIFMPDTSQRTFDWLRHHNDPDLYTRHVFQQYAHMDLWIGRDASRDIFPYVLERLEAHDPASTAAATSSPGASSRR